MNITFNKADCRFLYAISYIALIANKTLDVFLINKTSTLTLNDILLLTTEYKPKKQKNTTMCPHWYLNIHV